MISTRTGHSTGDSFLGVEFGHELNHLVGRVIPYILVYLGLVFKWSLDPYSIF